MTDITISLRVDKSLHEEMKKHQELNWSALLRNLLSQYLESLEKKERGKAKRAAEEMDRIRKSGIFNKGKSGVEIIREWRNKRR